VTGWNEDGKPDLLIGTPTIKPWTIYLNQSQPGNLRFAEPKQPLELPFMFWGAMIKPECNEGLCHDSESNYPPGHGNGGCHRPRAIFNLDRVRTTAPHWQRRQFQTQLGRQWRVV
jgi:hypothetical protein